MSTKFENLAENPLDGVMVSSSRRIEYADIAIERMKENNPGGFLTLLAEETQLKRDAYAGNLSAQKMSEALRIGFTSEVEGTTQEFTATTAKFEGLVKSVFDKTSNTYLSFFPFGLAEFHKANQAQIPLLLDRMIDLSLKHQTVLGNIAFHDQFVDIKARFANAYSMQKQAGGSVSNTTAAKEFFWNELKKQLYKVMLSILLQNIDHPSIMLSYFEPRLLRFRHHKAETSTAYTTVIAPNTTIAANIAFSVNDSLLIINNGNMAVYYYGAASTNEAPKTPAVEILPGDEAEVTAVALGAPGNKFLMLINKDTSLSAEVEIALI